MEVVVQHASLASTSPGQTPAYDPTLIDTIFLSLSALRLLIPAVTLCTLFGAFGSRVLHRIVTNLQNIGYDALPPSTPGVASPLNPFSPTQHQKGNGSTETAPDEDGIFPVVVPQKKPRRGLIYALLALVPLLYFADGLILTIRGIITPIWEPRDLPAYAHLDWFDLGGLVTFAVAAEGMVWDERAAGEPGKWGGWPKVVVLEAWIGEVAVIVLTVITVLKGYRDTHLSVYSILHMVVLALRVLALSLLSLAFTQFLYRKSFVPLASLVQDANGGLYGTFGAPSARAGSSTNGVATPDPPNKPTNALSTKPVFRQVQKSKGPRAMCKRIALLFPYLWPHRSLALQLIALFCFALLVVGRTINAFVPVTLGKVTQELTDGVAPWITLGVYVVLRFLQGNGGIVQVLQNTAWIPVAQHVDRSMSTMTFNHLMDLSLSYHTRRKTGEVLRVLDRGGAINSFFQMFLFSFVPIFFDIGVAVIYLAVRFDLSLAGMLLGVMVIYVYVSVLLTQWRTSVRREANDKDKYSRGIQGDSLMNWETIVYFTAKDFEVARYVDAIRDYQQSEFRVLSSLYGLNLAQNCIIAVALLIGCFAVAYQVNIGAKTVGDFVTFVAYIGQLVGPLNQLGTLYRVVQNNVVDADNLIMLLNEPKEIQDRPDAKVVETAKGAIEFKNVSFSYDGKVTALDDISFTVPPGSSVALVGETGSGKSTLLRLLFRFYDPTAGSISLDGVDIRDLTQSSYRSMIGTVPQDTLLFNETIRYNIAYGNIKARDGAGPSMEDVEEAAKAAQIHSKIMTFPDGYETRVGERGVRLSGGEKQRVAIARVLIRNPPILLLDEATSALDSTTEREIQASLHTLAVGRTTVSIAHRLSTIVNSDLILVIGDGKVIERGSHAELIGLDGQYASLWRKQSRAEKEGLDIAKPKEAVALAAVPHSASGTATPAEHVHQHHC